MGPRAEAASTSLAGAIVFLLVASSCQPGDEPKTPVNAPFPTKLERPDDPVTTPRSPVDGGGGGP